METDRKNPAEGLIRRARERRGLSAAEVAQLARISTSTVLDTETRPWATVRQLARYAEILGYDLHVCYREPGSKQCAIE